MITNLLKQAVALRKKHLADSTNVELSNQMVKLFARIPAEITAADIHASTQTFAISNQEIPLEPARTAGERLINWLIEHPKIVL